ncbi:MAG: hypothetical protein ACI8T1_004605 [Verrucomicrobiales bacterium]|jgi:uncharacterized protein (TIGR04255 family)
MSIKSIIHAKAPIVEAVFDIQCKVKDGFDLKGLKAAASAKLGNDYPTARDQFISTHQITPDGVSLNQGLRGFHFHSADSKQIVQFRSDGFTFNRLVPYTSWNALQPQAKQLWEVFNTLAPVEEVSRIALRYINRLLLPTGVPLSDWLHVRPASDTLDGLTPTGFLTRIQFTDGQGNLGAVNVTTQPAQGQELPILLDIETTRIKAFDLNNEELWQIFLDLRTLKNRLFDGSLTPACLDHYR